MISLQLTLVFNIFLNCFNYIHHHRYPILITFGNPAVDGHVYSSFFPQGKAGTHRGHQKEAWNARGAAILAIPGSASKQVAHAGFSSKGVLVHI